MKLRMDMTRKSRPTGFSTQLIAVRISWRRKVVPVVGRLSWSTDAIRLIPATTLRTIATSQITVDVPVPQLDYEALATLPTGYVSKTDFLATSGAGFRMRVVQHRSHLMVSDGDREYVLTVGTMVLKVHLITQVEFGSTLFRRYHTPGISLYRTL